MKIIWSYEDQDKIIWRSCLKISKKILESKLYFNRYFLEITSQKRDYKSYLNETRKKHKINYIYYITDEI